MSSSDRPDYVQQNVANWTRANTDYTDDSGSRAWAQEEITWGVFETPESELNLLGDVNGLDVVELGCGTAYFSSWLARRGATVVGVDPTPAQLETARRLQGETGIEFPLIEAIGEDVPLPDSSFDLVLSEYGASLWADPYRWVPEAARLLRPGGRLVFLTNSTVSVLCMTMDGVGEQLVRPQFELGRFDRAPARERVRDRAPRRAVRDPRVGNTHVLQVRHGRVGPTVAPRRSVGRA
jgi:SAM-dependent methyltransferase